MRSLLQNLPGNFDVSNVANILVVAAALVLYVQGSISQNVLILLIGAAVGSESLIDAGKKKTTT